MTTFVPVILSSRLGDARVQMIGRASLGDWRPTWSRPGRSSAAAAVGRDQ